MHFTFGFYVIGTQYQCKSSNKSCFFQILAILMEKVKIGIHDIYIKQGRRRQKKDKKKIILDGLKILNFLRRATVENTVFFRG